MSHLSRDERLLALDDVLDAPRAGHLSACPSCQAEVHALRVVVARVKAVEVPEPSPLFWDHLAARVGDAIAREPLPVAAPPWWHLPQLAWAVAGLVVVVAGTGYLSTRRPAPTVPVVAHGTPSPDADGSVAPGAAEPDARGDGWGLVVAMAEESDAAAFAPSAGEAELSISDLSPDERRALVVELEAALVPGGGREG